LSKHIPRPLPEEQIKLAVNFSNPITCFQHSLLSRSATELFVSSPVLFWLLVSHSSIRKWKEKRFIDTAILKRTEILGIVCGCPNKLSTSALRFLSKFNGSKLQNDKTRETLTEWVRTGKYKQIRHYKLLSVELLNLFDEFPELVGAKWTHSIKLNKVEIREYRNLIRDMLIMADAIGHSLLLNKALLNFSSRADVQKHHDAILKLYFKQIGVLSPLVFPDPPLAGTQAIIPITNSNLLFQEGIDQDNCVYSYLDEILASQYFVYQVMDLERATLGISIGFNGAIELDQLMTASNSSVSRQTSEIVDDWLNSIIKGSQLFLTEHKQKIIDDCMTAYLEYGTFQNSNDAT